MGCEIIHCVCHYFRKLCHAEDRVHIADPNIVVGMIMGDASDITCSNLRVDPDKVRGLFVTNYPDMCWSTHISKGRAVYVTVNYQCRQLPLPHALVWGVDVAPRRRTLCEGVQFNEKI